MKITTAHYHTPKGRDINEVGIEPNEEVEFEGRSYTGKDDTQFATAARQLLEEIETQDRLASRDQGMPKARTGVEQWRYLLSLGRGEPEVLERNFVRRRRGSVFFEELKVLFPDALTPELIRFDLGPALGISS